MKSAGMGVQRARTRQSTGWKKQETFPLVQVNTLLLSSMRIWRVPMPVVATHFISNEPLIPHTRWPHPSMARMGTGRIMSLES